MALSTTTLREARSLTHDERSLRTRDLLARAAESQDDDERRELLDQVVVLNMRIAEALARRYVTATVALEDLVQVAYAALVRAVHQWDVTRDADLLTYAVPTIRGELRRHLRDHGWTVRPPRDVQRAHSRLQRAGIYLERYADGDLETLAATVGEETNTVAEAIHARQFQNLLSLDRPLGEDEHDTVASLVAEEQLGSSPGELVELRSTLAPLLAELAPRDRTIIELRFVEEMSQRAIARQVGLSQMQVSRILTRVLDQLRDRLAGDQVALPVAS